MFQSLRIRITVLCIVLLVVLYTVSSVAVYAFVRETVMGNIRDQLVFGLRHELATGSPHSGVANLYGIVADGAGNVAVSPQDLPQNVLKAIDPTQPKQGYISYRQGDNRYEILYYPVGSANGQTFAFFATAVDYSQQLGVLTKLEQVIVIVGVFGLAVATLVGFFLADRMLRPIRSAWARQLEFVADASHELRTPLAVVQSNLGIVMEHTDQSVEENLEWLNNAHGESRRLSKLVKDLLTLARSDSERTPIERELVDLQELMGHIHELYETVTAVKGIEFTLHAPEPIRIAGDKDRLHQLIVILLDNAVKFTPEGGHIELTLSQQKNVAVVTVQDSGLGIDKEHLHRVFDRFFTVDPARSREHAQRGTGLGLSIARWVVDAHGGKIAIASEGVGKGTTVRVELPLVARQGK